MLGDMAKFAPHVIARAANKTMTGIRTDTTNEIAKEITTKKKTIRDTITVLKMSPKTLTGFVRSKGRPLNLIHFKARETKKGVTLQVYKKDPRKLIEHAFVIKGLSGEKKVYWRKKGEWEHTGRGKKPGVKYGALPFHYRFPVQLLSGPRIPDVMAKERILKSILSKADERIEKNLDHEVTRELKKHA